MSSILKVLLVEDDPEVRLGTKQALELAGFEVEPFTDAETAATRIVPDVPAIVVCDVNLPGMDGLSLLSHARSVDNDLAVILITGHGDIAMAVNAMRQGAYDFVEKPFSPQRLIDVAARAAENAAWSCRSGPCGVSLRTNRASNPSFWDIRRLSNACENLSFNWPARLQIS